jgi:uncharacterized protein YggE
MRNRFVPFIIILICLALPGALFSQEHPSVAAQPDTVFVGADGRYETQPDTAVLQFNISAQEETSKAAYERAARNAEQIRQILRSNGVDPKTAEMGFMSIQPVYDWKSPKRKLVGYRVNAGVTLKLKDFAKVGPIVQQIADADITDNQSLNYMLDNMDAAKTRAVEDAYRRARDSANAVARAGGRTLGDLSYASVDTFEPAPRPVPGVMAYNMKAASEAAPPPTQEFSAQNIVVTAHVNALFMLK